MPYSKYEGDRFLEACWIVGFKLPDITKEFYRVYSEYLISQGKAEFTVYLGNNYNRYEFQINLRDIKGHDLNEIDRIMRAALPLSTE